MFPEAHVSAREELLDGKLHLYSMGRFESLLNTSREHLRLLASGAGSSYRPFPKRQRLRPFQKKFKPAKIRIIDNPDDALKDFQSRINEKLLKCIAFPHYLCGGVSGKTILDNVLMHFGAAVLVSVDIKSFFRRISNRQVYRVWRETLDCSPRIAALLTQLTTFERHLPQGAPTSSLLANLVLYSVDQPIRDECASRGVTYSTWVDDLAFSGRDARSVISAVVESLRAAGFSISHKKLKVMGPGTRRVLNGVLLGRFPSVLPDRISRLRSGIHKLRMNEVPSGQVDKYIRQLEGGITFVASIVPHKAGRLRSELNGVLMMGSPLGPAREEFQQLKRIACQT